MTDLEEAMHVVQTTATKSASARSIARVRSCALIALSVVAAACSPAAPEATDAELEQTQALISIERSVVVGSNSGIGNSNGLSGADSSVEPTDAHGDLAASDLSDLADSTSDDSQPEHEAGSEALAEADTGLQLQGSNQKLAEAMARFLKVPAGLLPPDPVTLVGLDDTGTCRSDIDTQLLDPALGLSAAENIELLDVGEVAIGSGSRETNLAKHTFAVSRFVRGVVYTTRDRSAKPLPPDASYTLTASGTDAFPALVVSAEAPSDLETVSVEGTSLVDVESVRAGEALTLNWKAGKAGDLVYVDLTAALESSGDNNEGSPINGSVRCAFRDEDGSGTINSQWLRNLSGPVRFSLHRSRTLIAEPAVSEEPALDDKHPATALLQFDFEVTKTVQFVR